jgi:hypothetical protein
MRFPQISRALPRLLGTSLSMFFHVGYIGSDQDKPAMFTFYLSHCAFGEVLKIRIFKRGFRWHTTPLYAHCFRCMRQRMGAAEVIPLD